MVSRVSSRTAFFLVTEVVLMLVFSFCKTINANERFCPDQASVDLTNATRNATGFLDQSGHFFPTPIVRNRDGAWRGCICDIKPCLPLCPTLKNAHETEPEHFRNTSAEISAVFMANLTLEDDAIDPVKRFYIFAWDPCVDGFKYLEPDEDEKDEWYLLKNGSLFLHTESLIDWTRYCLRQRMNETIFTPRVCSVKGIQVDGFTIAIYTCVILSVPFLLATIVVYSVLPELRHIHGNIFRCYLGCLLVVFMTVGVQKISPLIPKFGTVCYIHAFTRYFSCMACFFWLNIMSFNLWWTFGGYGSLQTGNDSTDRKKFIKYSIYAWGIAAVLTTICIFVEFSPGLSESVIRPGFNQGNCWFSTKISKGLFFVFPLGLTIICNICFFISTAIRLVRHKKKTQRELSSAEGQRHEDDNLTFSLYLKLFLIMGISWLPEVMMNVWEEPKYLWYPTDFVNALQGVLIFIIFVCKKKIWQSLKSRFKFFRKSNRAESASPQPSNSDFISNTNGTTSSSVTSLSDSISLDEIIIKKFADDYKNCISVTKF